MFALGVRYLRGVAVATDAGDYEHAEWPPHPARIFMAMVAAHFETGAEPTERSALEWLEAIGDPPRINCSDAFHRDVATRFVPVNDRAGPSKAPLQSAPGLTRDRAGRTFPTVRPFDDAVFLIWDTDCPPVHARALERVCDKVSRIGHSSSLVQMWVEPRPPEAVWVRADESVAMRLRTITPGLLRYLEECANMEPIREYAALSAAVSSTKGRQRQQLRDEMTVRFPAGEPSSMRPRISTWQGYARAATIEQLTIPSSIWENDLVILRMEAIEGAARHLDLSTAFDLTQRLHEAVLSHSPQPIPEYVSGHAGDSASERPHLAYLPLAFVGAPHADGLIRGLGMAVPRGLSPAQRRIVLTAIAGVRELRLGGLGRWALRVELGDPPLVALTSRTWTGGQKGARTWATVTTVAFDRHPKARDRAAYEQELHEMIASACQRIGLPAPESVVITPVSAHLGAPAAHEFPRMRRKDGSLRRHAHAIIRFSEPIIGPVMLGAGRYRGYGLCRPLRAEELG
jgi:CRISPR-associated protein Csb2